MQLFELIYSDFDVFSPNDSETFACILPCISNMMNNLFYIFAMNFAIEHTSHTVQGE